MQTTKTGEWLVCEGAGVRTFAEVSGDGRTLRVVDLADGIVRIRHLERVGGRWVMRQDATLETFCALPVDVGIELLELAEVLDLPLAPALLEAA